MKKLSFFLMAMLISLVSFAQDAPIYELVPASGSNNGYAGNCDITIDGIKWNLTGNSTMQPWRIGGKGITNQDRALYSKTPLAYNIDKIEVTHGTASGITVNSFKLIISDEANGTGETIDVAFKASATTTIDLPEGDYTNKYFKFLYNVTNSTNSNKFVQFTGAKFYAALAADDVKAPIIDGDADFISETEVTIEAEDDVTVYYTLDGTDPTTASTVYAAPFTVKETTTVKAIAYRGENASFVTSATFTQATRVTAAEAAELAMKVASNNALTSVTYVINAYVTEVIDQTLSSGQQRFWVADTKDGGQVLQSYYCYVPQVLKVGDYIQMFGKLTKFNTNPQMKNGDVTIAEEPVIEEPTIECKDALDFGAVAYNAEVAAQTLEVTAYNLTSDITVTLSEGAAFTVDQATLSAEGGNLVVTPVSPLTVGTHTATLTLASGEATAEVTLTIVAKDVYTITWYVNGEIYDETTVVEGDKLVLPAVPEAPEACSEKVFVGWTAAEEVNADGSDIEWVTAATAPTAAATYYAVFAAQEGEGGASEVVDVLNRALTGVEGTSYTDWEKVSATSTAVYAGQSAGGNEAIQLRSNNSNSGVISTTSGGKLAKITVTWNSNTTSGRTLNVYGSNTAYTSPTELYGDASGEKLGTIVNGTSTELEIDGDYAYVGLRSNSGAMYLDEIQITWIAGAAATYTDYSTTCEPEIPTYTVTVSDNTGGFEPLTTGGGEYKEDDNATVTASEEVEGWVFVGWMANEEFVANDPTYTFAVEGNTELVAIYAQVMEDEITNLVIDTDWMVMIGGPSTMYEVEVYLGLGEGDVEEGFLLSDESFVSIMGQDATWIDGMAFDIDLDANVATAIVVVEWDGSFLAITLAMSAAPAEPTNVVVTSAVATYDEGSGALKLTGIWEGAEVFIEIAGYDGKESVEYNTPQGIFFETPDVTAFGNEAEITVAGEDITVVCEGLTPMWGSDVYNVTITTLAQVNTALDNVTTTVAPAKAIVNGQLVIVKDGVQYNAQGAVIK